MEYLRSNYDPLHMFAHKLSYKANWASMTRVACHACRAYCTARRHSMQPRALQRDRRDKLRASMYAFLHRRVRASQSPSSHVYSI